VNKRKLDLRKEIEEYLQSESNFELVLRKSKELYDRWEKIISCGIKQKHRN
jgi:hypothetical protein